MSNPFFSSKLASAFDVATSGATAVLGQPIDAARLSKFSVQVVRTGLAGADASTKVKLQVSNVLRHDGSPRAWSDTDADWVDVSLAEVTLVNGSGSSFFSSSDIPARFVRVVFTKGAATGGTLDVFVSCKSN